MLGRARRRVLLFDHGRYRNAASRHMHGYLSRDGLRPTAFLGIGRRELAAYGVEIRGEEVLEVLPQGAGFDVVLARGRIAAAKKLLLANGVVDRIPAIPGIESLYGRSVHHCPYCDAWEWRDRRLAVYGRGRGGVDLAHSLLTWSRDVVLLTDRGRVAPDEATELDARGVRIVPNRILRLEGNGGSLRSVVFQNREPLARDALFFSTGNQQSCSIAIRLGCRITPKDAVWTNRYAGTNVPGVYAAGDAAWAVQFVIVAAAEGAKAAVAINRELHAEERHLARTRRSPK